MKKVVSILLTVAILGGMMSAFCLSASAQGNELIFDIGEVAAAEGAKKVSVPIVITSNPGISGAQIKLYYDSNTFDLCSIDATCPPGKEIETQFFPKSYYPTGYTPSDFGGEIDFYVYDCEDVLADASISSTGTLMVLDFELNYPKVGENYMFRGEVARAWDSEGLELGGTIEDGSVSVLGDIKVVAGKADKTSAFPGETVTLTANAAPSGKVFDKWTSDGVVFANAYSQTTTFVMPQKSITVQATYKNKTYPITVKGGKANVAEATAGQTVTITANSPAKGMAFDAWICNGVAVSDKNSSVTQFVMPAAPVSFEATYREQPNYGDINGDGEISLKDLLQLRKYLADMIKTIDKAADVNADGTVNMKDVLMLRMYLAEQISVLGV